MGVVIEMPTRHGRGRPRPSREDLEEAELIAGYFRYRVRELTPGSPDRLLVERFLARWEAWGTRRGCGRTVRNLEGAAHAKYHH